MLDDNRVRAIGDLGVHPNLRMGACVPRRRVLAYDMLALWYLAQCRVLCVASELRLADDTCAVSLTIAPRSCA